MKAVELRRLALGMEMLEADEKINETILTILNADHRFNQGYVDRIPFSERLNEWIKDWFSKHMKCFHFVDTDDFDESDIEGTFKKHKQRWEREGVIHIWTGASDKTIFGDAGINIYFRAWHDYLHLKHDLGYDFIGETAVAQIQMAMLPKEWHFERMLVNSEVVGQALYFMKHGKFIEDQRKFTITFLETGQI